MTGELTFTSNEMFSALGGVTVARGIEIFDRGGVTGRSTTENGARIAGVVVGDVGKTYHQTIALARVGQRLQVRGYCSCPMSQNCKHVAAVLAATLAEQRRAVAQTSPQPASGQTSPAVAPTHEMQIATRTWLDKLARAATPRTTSKEPSRVVRYILSMDKLQPGLARVRTVSTLPVVTSDERQIDPGQWQILKNQGSKFLTDVDLDNLRNLAQLARTYGLPTVAPMLHPDLATNRLLERMIESGRLHDGDVRGPVLRMGPAIAAGVQWIKHDGARQRLEFVSADGEAFDAVLALDPPYYISRARAEVGPLAVDLPKELATEIARAPLIGAAEAALVKDALSRQLPRRTSAARAETRGAAAGAGNTPEGTPLLPLPEAAETVEARRVKPTLHLRLTTTQATLRPEVMQAGGKIQGWADDGTAALPIAEVSFGYGTARVPLGAGGGHIEEREDDKVVIYERLHDVEKAARRALSTYSLHAIAELQTLLHVGRDKAHACAFDLDDRDNDITFKEGLAELLQPLRYVLFLQDHAPALAKEGWQITVADDFPFHLAAGDPDFWADAKGGDTGIDWFSFELGIQFEGQRLNIVPQLAALIANLPPDILALRANAKTFDAAVSKVRLFVTLPDKRLLPLPGERIAPMLRGLLELIGPRAERVSDGQVKMHRAEAAALAGFAKDLSGVAWAASADRILELGHALRRGTKLKPTKPTKSFKARLRDYQGEGLAWLNFLRESGFGGVLADDMGLGKTVQGLAFLSGEKAAGRLDKPALIVAPTSVLPNWQAEAERFAPDLKVLSLRGSDRRERFSDIATSDLVLTTYPLLVRDFDMIAKHQFHVAMLDEAQAIKNPKANVSQVAHRINARHRFALTGTPLENNLGEVWSLFEFLSPGLLGDEGTFRRVFRMPIERHGDRTAQNFLTRRLKPFMLRRTKQEVAKELPPKTEIIERIQLDGAQRDLYETVRVLVEKRVREEIDKKGLAKSHIVFLDALLKLRQICCDPRLLKLDAAKKVKQSAKLERLMELVPEMVAEGRKILIFSQFTSMLDLIETELKREKIAFVTIRGDTDDRGTPVKQFQSGSVPVFLLSLKAGGTGLNLTAADTVIHYDPWWNPAVENQATDRAYRIGQDKPVFVHKLIVEDGIEEAIELLKAKKAALAEALFEGTTRQPLQLTEADVSALFAPLSRPSLKKAA